MITFWDTSAAINALVSPEVFDRLKTGRHVARPHLLAEFFSIMTGRGIRTIDDQQQEIQTTMENIRSITDNVKDLSEDSKRFPAQAIFGAPPPPSGVVSK